MKFYRLRFSDFERLLKEDGDAIFPVEIPADWSCPTSYEVRPAGLHRARPLQTEGGAGFVSYTCVECGKRSRTWDTFRAHRRVCTGPAHPSQAVTPGLPDDWAP